MYVKKCVARDVGYTITQIQLQVKQSLYFIVNCLLETIINFKHYLEIELNTSDKKTGASDLVYKLVSTQLPEYR